MAVGFGKGVSRNNENGDLWTDGVRTNTWDSQNRLVSCTYDNITSAFTYGSDGLRRSMTVGSDPTTYFALDGQNVAQEGHVNGGAFVPDVTYLNGGRGVEYREDSSGVRKWYVYDGLGSVVAEVDTAGNVTTGYTDSQGFHPALRKFDVYGAERGTPLDGAGDQKFCGGLGHTTEPDTGNLIYMRARWMDPVTGRFISEDPVRQGYNWFVYCGDNPVNASDFTGKVAGFDDWLNEEAEDATASVEVKNAFAQEIENAVMDWYDKLIRSIVGDCEDMALKPGSRGNYRWIFKQGDETYQIRLDLSGTHGPHHWNFDWLAHSDPGHFAQLPQDLMDVAGFLGF